MTQHGHTDGPEYLDSRGGAPLGAPRARGSRRGVAIAVAATVGAVAVGAGAWAAWSFFSQGDQPAQALPASTVAYASIDLDPSGGQKIEALQTLRKFPAFKKEVGIGKDADVRKWIVDQAGDEAGCDLDFDRDVKPWLGNRFAIAAVDSGEDEPDPLFVLQVSDEDEARQGLTKIRDCGGGSETGAWAISDGWALVGETQKIVDRAADDAAEKSLADDDDFKTWTDRAGDSGIVSMYASPAAGELLAENLGSLDPTGVTGVPSVSSDETRAALEDFRGAAATIRFDDGGLELEAATDPGKDNRKLSGGDQAGRAVSSLPASTVAALSFSFGDGWGQALMDQLDAAGLSEEVQEMSDSIGLDLPADAETLAGDALTVAMDGDADLEGFFEGSSRDLGVGVKMVGDPDEIDGVMDKLRTAAGGQDGGFLDTNTGKGAVALGPDADFRKSLLKDGGLGRSDTFKRVVEHADDAGAIVYVDFDGSDGWLAKLAEDDDEVRDNLEPLGALGFSTWQEDGVSHGVLKLTTD